MSSCGPLTELPRGKLDAEAPAVSANRSALDDFFEMSLDNVCVAGLDGYFKRVNPSWTRTLGWTAEELTSRPNIEFVHPDDRQKTLEGRARLRDGSALGPLVNRYLCKDGSYRWFEWRSVADVGRGLVYAIARDVTEQKRAQERLRAAQELQQMVQRQLIFTDRMTSVGTLAAGVAHEINNPLAFVSSNMQLVLEELRELSADRPDVRIGAMIDMINDALTGTERIRKIVYGLKTFSRAEQERRTIVDLNALLELCINMTASEVRHRARLVTDFAATPPVEADEARLGHVFVNLLVNAAQAIGDGAAETNEIRIATATDAAGRAVVDVSDTGVGIPTHLLGRVFDPFFTTKPPGLGTGLGLSICHSVVTALGGEITVDSRPGVGTRFRVVLPAATTPSTTG